MCIICWRILIKSPKTTPMKKWCINKIANKHVYIRINMRKQIQISHKKSPYILFQKILNKGFRGTKKISQINNK